MALGPVVHVVAVAASLVAATDRRCRDGADGGGGARAGGAAGPWVPLTDPGPRTARVDAGDADPLRVTLARLARLGPGERACVQLIVTPERSTAGTRGGGAAWWARGLLFLLTLPIRAGLVVADLFLPGPSGSRASGPTVRPHGDRTEEDPATEARRKAIALKQGHGPHLRVTLRVAYT